MVLYAIISDLSRLFSLKFQYYLLFQQQQMACSSWYNLCQFLSLCPCSCCILFLESSPSPADMVVQTVTHSSLRQGSISSRKLPQTPSLCWVSLFAVLIPSKHIPITAFKMLFYNDLFVSPTRLWAPRGQAWLSFVSPWCNIDDVQING